MRNHSKLFYNVDNAGVEDGPDIHNLVGLCPSLDQNSRYFYLLLCSHFNRYTLAAKKGKELIGFVSAYHHPKLVNTLFIWQIAVAPRYREIGIANEMVKRLIQLATRDGLSYIEATVTPSNLASLNMFKKIVNIYKTGFQQSVCFPTSLFADGHEREMLLRIGPINNKGSESDENL